MFVHFTCTGVSCIQEGALTRLQVWGILHTGGFYDLTSGLGDENQDTLVLSDPLVGVIALMMRPEDVVLAFCCMLIQVQHRIAPMWPLSFGLLDLFVVVSIELDRFSRNELSSRSEPSALNGLSPK